MVFKESKPIYLQIADRIMDEILLGKYPAGERIPSVREYAALVEVNANTVVRSYDYLQNLDIIYNKRGLGYFTHEGARAAIRSSRRKSFLTESMPEVFRQMELLEVSTDEIAQLYQAYLAKNKSINIK